jgi:hypothetical protein
VIPSRRWEDNINIDVKEIRCEGVDWTHLAQDRDQVCEGADWILLAQEMDQLRDLLKTIMNLRFP